MVILRPRNKITDFFMILAWASPFKFVDCSPYITVLKLSSLRAIYNIDREMLKCGP